MDSAPSTSAYYRKDNSITPKVLPNIGNLSSSNLCVFSIQAPLIYKTLKLLRTESEHRTSNTEQKLYGRVDICDDDHRGWCFACISNTRMCVFVCEYVYSLRTLHTRGGFQMWIIFPRHSRRV